MFEMTKAAVNCLFLEELYKARNAIMLLNSMGIDNDRYQTLEYINQLIKHLEERSKK
jgi:hypothetical protein